MGVVPIKNTLANGPEKCTWKTITKHKLGYAIDVCEYFGHTAPPIPDQCDPLIPEQSDPPPKVKINDIPAHCEPLE